MRVLAYTGSEEPSALRASGAETLADLRELPEGVAAAT
jgi:hypothetical protein